MRAVWHDKENYRTHYNQWCCLHWMGHDKFLTVNCCHVLFMKYWHKFKMIFNGYFVTSSVDRLYLAQHDTKTVTSCVDKPSFVPQKFSSFFFYPPSACFFILSSLGSTNVRHLSLCALSSASWVDMSLTADWLQVCFGTQPDSLKKYIPHL